MFYREYDDGIIIRTMSWMDLTQLVTLSPASVKNPMDFAAYATIVAEDGNSDSTKPAPILGYAQFTIGPDKVLHSQAIRIDATSKGKKIGSRLCEVREEIAKAVGATMHIYAIDVKGEEALKRIVVSQGMMLFQRRGAVYIYMKSLSVGE